MSNRRVAGLVAVTLGLSFSALPVHAANRYVDVHCATPLSPYLSWSTAATNIQDAIDVAVSGETIWVSNGQYNISAQIRLTNGIKLRSVNGAANTVIEGSNSTRCVYLGHSNAVIDGFTIRGGRLLGHVCGSGVFCEKGTIRNCHICNNWAERGQYTAEAQGSGVYLLDGLLENSMVSSNGIHNGSGIGVYVVQGVVRSCMITDNSPSDSWAASGGGVYLEGGLVEDCQIIRNGGRFLIGAGLCIRQGIAVGCLIADNWYVNDWGGSPPSGPCSGGIRADGGEIRNCTVVSNRVGLDWHGGGQLVNTIIYSNSGGNCHFTGSGSNAALSFCCSAPMPPGFGNISNEPNFVSWSTENYRLQQGSPCIDRGTTLRSPTQDLDQILRPLDGNGDGYSATDMGCYEYHAATFQGLTNGGVFPNKGLTNTPFAFTVNYQGATPAVTNELVVDNFSNAMVLAYGATTCGVFSFSGRLPVGNHAFHIQAIDATGGSYRLPAVGEFNGPFVSSQATLSNSLVTPTNGDCDTLFQFSVSYYDAGQTSPATNYVVVNNSFCVMSLTNGTSTDGLFEADMLLPVGTNCYYFYSVDAIAGEYRLPLTESSTELVVQDCVATPSNVVASQGTYANRVSVSWNNASNATGYEIWRAPSNGLGLAVRSMTTSQKAYDDTSATQDTYYYYWVRATNQNVQSDFSTSAVGFASYPPPSFVTASDGAYTDEVALAWTAVSNVALYQVWRNTTTNSGGAGLLADNVAATNLDDFLIENGLLFYYWVKSKGNLGSSPFGARDSGFAPVAAPANMTASDGTYTDRVVVSWDAASRATSYEIWWSQGTDTGTCSQIGGSSASPYADSEITPGQGGFYWVKSRNALGPSWFSDPDYGSRDGTGAVPEEIRMVKGADSRSAIFQCESLTGRHYTVEVATNLFGEWVSNSVTAVAGNGRWMNCATSDISSQLFYRVVSGTNN